MRGHADINALELLRSDHRVISRLFRRVRTADASRHAAIFALVHNALDVHMHIEESVLYPAIVAGGDATLAGLIREGVEEHHQVKMFLDEMAGLVGDTDIFEPKLRVLIEDFEHHAAEEESVVFPLVAEQFDREALFHLGRAIKEERDFKKIQSAALRQRIERPASNGHNIPFRAPTAARPPFHFDRY